MNKADKYYLETIKEIQEVGQHCPSPRTVWSDGKPAKYKSVFQKRFEYDLDKGEFPINTLRTTPFKGCFHEMEWFYIHQSSDLADADPSIWSWWSDFTLDVEESSMFGLKKKIHNTTSIGKTYGYVVAKYDLMNKLLFDLEHNPYSRRKMISLWDNQSQLEDSKALPPCVYQTYWIVRDVGKERFVDLTLYQRSCDYMMTSSINPVQYTFLLLMVVNHLNYKTKIKHKVGKIVHNIEDVHIYDRHWKGANEVLNRKPTGLQPKIEIVCEPKNFYEHKWEDFKIINTQGIVKLSERLEIAI